MRWQYLFTMALIPWGEVTSSSCIQSVRHELNNPLYLHQYSCKLAVHAFIQFKLYCLCLICIDIYRPTDRCINSLTEGAVWIFAAHKVSGRISGSWGWLNKVDFLKVKDLISTILMPPSLSHMVCWTDINTTTYSLVLYFAYMSLFR